MGEDGARVPSPRGSSLWWTSSRDDERRAVSCWLAQAHPISHQVHEEWLRHGVALLPLGRHFDAIRVPAARIHAALGTDDPATVTADLADRLHGPVIRDTRSGERPYYVLVAPAAEWDGDGAEERLSAGTYLGVPRLGPLSTAAAWAVPPKHAGDLCDPARLRAVLALADGVEVPE
ncbi:hypothetical protein [Streptomyces alboflavus]|uniref:hypothetical protein n=1 Tax=Streptomyces alboflavus TaxID=67267 RepID=UPI003680BBC6